MYSAGGEYRSARIVLPAGLLTSAAPSGIAAVSPAACVARPRSTRPRTIGRRRAKVFARAWTSQIIGKFSHPHSEALDDYERDYNRRGVSNGMPTETRIGTRPGGPA